MVSADKDKATTEWISTNDSLCALLWCSITTARARDAPETHKTVSYFNMMVDCRSRLSPPISSDYSGNVILVTKAQAEFGHLPSAYPSRIAEVARLLRRSLLAVDDTYIKDVMETIRTASDISHVTPRHYPSFERNVGCTSWADQAYYELDWGTALGGQCDRVRTRPLTNYDGFFAIMPRLPSAEGCTANDSGLEVVLGLQSEHLQRICEDETFRKYAQWQSG